MSFNFSSVNGSVLTDEIEMVPVPSLSRKNFENIPPQQRKLSKQDEKARNRFLEYRNTAFLTTSPSPAPRAKSPLPEITVISQEQSPEHIFIRPSARIKTPSPFLLEQISLSPIPVSQRPSPMLLDRYVISPSPASRPASPLQLDTPYDPMV